MKDLEIKEAVEGIRKFELWYKTLGHINPKSLIELKEIISNKVFDDLTNSFEALLNLTH